MAENRPPGRSSKHFQRAPGRGSARRNLFGRDPSTAQDNLIRDVEELTRDSERRFRERWNYDVTADRPVKGDLDWGPGIPVRQRGPLLHVPSEMTSSASTASSVSCDDEMRSRNRTPPPSLGSRSSPGEDRSIRSNGNTNGYNCDQPPLKKQRSSDSDESDDNCTGSNSKSANC